MRIKQLGLILLPGVLVLAQHTLAADQPYALQGFPDSSLNTEVIPLSPNDFAPADTLSKDTAAKKSEVDDVRTQLLVAQEYYDRVLDRTVARANRWLTISGNISTRFSYVQREKKDSITFHIPTALLGFRGTLYRDFQTAKNLTYALTFSSAGGVAPTVADATIAYSPLSSIDLLDPVLNITLGQQKKPFGAEAQSTDETSPSVTGSAYLSGLLSDVSQRDIGLVVRGDLLPAVDYGYNYRSPLISYNFAVLNGTGPNVADNNVNKEVIGRVIFAPPVDYYNPLRGLTIGGSYATSEKLTTATASFLKTPAKTIKIRTLSTGKDSVITYLATAAVNGSVTDTIQGERTRFGFDVSYIRTPVNLTVEGVFGSEVGTIAINKATDTLASFTHAQKNYVGGAITLFLNIGEQFLKGYREQSRPDDWWPFTWQPFLRIDAYDPDKDVSGIVYKPDGKTIDKDGRWQAVGTIGANLFFARTTKLQVNLRLKKTQGEPDGDFKNNEILAQFGYGF